MTQFQQLLQNEYSLACEFASDIQLHLPLIHDLANRCSHVTEFGVREGISSRAILSSRASKIRMYDIQEHERVRQMVSACVQNGMDVQYNIQSVLDVQIEPTEFLFIDTLHTYAQLKQELNRHSWRVSRYIAFHDTQTFGCQDEPGYSGPGLISAILEFLCENPQWQMMHHTPNNNGFTVIQRRE